MKPLSPLFLVLALCASGAMAAEDIYRSTMPDGSIRYGEAPDPAAKAVKKVPGPPPATGVTVVTPEERGRQFAPQQGGGATVIPTPARPPTQPASSGQTFSNTDLPKRNTGY